MGKPSERMSNLWTVCFSKTESELNFSFPHVPSYLRTDWAVLHQSD